MQLCMDIDIPWLEIPFHQQLILLHVSTAQDQVILTGDKPAARAWALAVSLQKDSTVSYGLTHTVMRLSWGMRDFQLLL